MHPISDDAAERWSTVPFHQSSFMCDDIQTTIAELQGHGVEVKPDVVDEGFGLVTSLVVPGAGWMMLYQRSRRSRRVCPHADPPISSPRGRIECARRRVRSRVPRWRWSRRGLGAAARERLYAGASGYSPDSHTRTDPRRINEYQRC